MAIRVFVTGGTFDKTYDEITGRLLFRDTHIQEMLRLGRCRLDVAVRTLTGTYYFPDYPKYSVWTDSYIMTTRDFGDGGGYGISVYALEKNKMIAGNAKARAVQFFLDSDVVPINLIGDGLLPADVDGKTKPKNDAWVPIVGTQDDNFAPYGATTDALNVFEMNVLWNSKPNASFRLAAQLSVAPFDSVFPCGPSRGCIPQPGITNPDQFIDILSYRQRPTYRLAKGGFEVQVAGERGFCPYSQMDIRRIEDPAAYLDQVFSFRIMEYSSQGRNLILSARAVLEEERAERKEALVRSLKEGDRVRAPLPRCGISGPLSISAEWTD